MATSRFSTMVEKVLRSAGWTGALTDKITLELPSDYVLFPAAEAVLREFGNLSIHGANHVWLEPAKSEARFRELTFTKVCHLTAPDGSELYPLGRINGPYHSYGWHLLVMDSKGVTYCRDRNFLTCIASTFDEALSKLLLGIKYWKKVRIHESIEEMLRVSRWTGEIADSITVSLPQNYTLSSSAEKVLLEFGGLILDIAASYRLKIEPEAAAELCNYAQRTLSDGSALYPLGLLHHTVIVWIGVKGSIYYECGGKLRYLARSFDAALQDLYFNVTKWKPRLQIRRFPEKVKQILLAAGWNGKSRDLDHAALAEEFTLFPAAEKVLREFLGLYMGFRWKRRPDGGRELEMKPKESGEELGEINYLVMEGLRIYPLGYSESEYVIIFIDENGIIYSESPAGISTLAPSFDEAVIRILLRLPWWRIDHLWYMNDTLPREGWMEEPVETVRIPLPKEYPLFAQARVIIREFGGMRCNLSDFDVLAMHAVEAASMYNGPLRNLHDGSRLFPLGYLDQYRGVVLADEKGVIYLYGKEKLSLVAYDFYEALGTLGFKKEYWIARIQGHRFPEIVTNTLKEAGWSGKLDEMLQPRVPEGYRLFPAAQRVLQEFEGLQIAFKNFFDPRDLMLVMDSYKAGIEYLKMGSTRAPFGRFVRPELYPLGYIIGLHAFFLTDSKGIIYTDGKGFGYPAIATQTFDEFIASCLLGKEPWYSY
ncbi:MAG: SUKH-3 domain-containing protein [Candidatus Methylacidiphilales bacterium]|nr:SUKH-3 domain-containing protein [Candidatus Methylacidiphilales bacterium]